MAAKYVAVMAAGHHRVNQTAVEIGRNKDPSSHTVQSAHCSTAARPTGVVVAMQRRRCDKGTETLCLLCSHTHTHTHTLSTYVRYTARWGLYSACWYTAIRMISDKMENVAL